MGSDTRNKISPYKNRRDWFSSPSEWIRREYFLKREMPCKLPLARTVCLTGNHAQAGVAIDRIATWAILSSYQRTDRAVGSA